jgi:PTH1 family peptidyl-tRNA hydrolase
MNHSGEILAAALRDYKPEALVVVYDDVDLPFGRLRVRRGGGAGGHRGVASVIDSCGREFARVRLGVGRPPASIDTADFVLLPLDEAERVALADMVDRAANAVECLVEDGVEVAMNRFNAEAAEAEGL